MCTDTTIVFIIFYRVHMQKVRFINVLMFTLSDIKGFRICCNSRKFFRFCIMHGTRFRLRGSHETFFKCRIYYFTLVFYNVSRLRQQQQLASHSASFSFFYSILLKLLFLASFFRKILFFLFSHEKVGCWRKHS